MSGDVGPYLALITSEHQTAPKFMATVSATLQPLADALVVLKSIPQLYDLDTAVGDQEDTVGKWVGRNRTLAQPLTGVYFSLDDDTVGFDSGTWFGPFDPDTGVTTLSDEPYRTLLRFHVQANSWDGTAADADRAYKGFFKSFPPGKYQVVVQDRQDMSVDLVLLGGTPDALTLALFTSDATALTPDAVKIGAYILQDPDNPIFFGFDAANQTLAGFDSGSWGSVLYP